MILAWAVLLCQQPSDAERLKTLEEKVQKQQEELDALKKAPAGGFTASPADGLRVKTADGNVDLHVGGRFQEHLRAVLDRPDASRTAQDTFFVKAARLKVDGTFFQDYGFQVEGDFPSSSTGPTPTLQASFVEWKRFKEFRLMFGQFKAPISQERLRSALFSDFIENTALTRFVPGYEIGVQAWGQVDLLGYQVAVINGRSHLDSQGRSRNDDNDEKELVARLTASPLKGLRFGVAGSVAEVDDVAATGAAVTTFDVATYELGVTFFDPGAPAAVVNLDGRRTRFSAEASWAVGPVCLRAEYLLRTDEMNIGTVEEDVDTKAWSGTLTWILTGEEKSPETRITPAKNFLEGGWGAVELAARIAGAEIGDEIEDLGVSLAGQSNEVLSATFGVNWWLTRNLRISANVIREDYKDDITFGGGRMEDVLTGFLARFQIDF
jgi:phosphate-selective porin OprO/OprP